MTGPIGTQAEVHFNVDTTNTGICTTAATVKSTNGNRQNMTLTNVDACAVTFGQPSSGTMSITVVVTQSAAGTGTLGTVATTFWRGTDGSFSTTPPTVTITGGAVFILDCYLNGTYAYCKM